MKIQIILSLIVAFVASFVLFYIFDLLYQFSERCKVERLEICEQLSEFTLSMLIILLIITGFIGIIATVGYILLSSLKA